MTQSPRRYPAMVAALCLLTVLFSLTACQMPSDEDFTVGELRAEPLSLHTIEVEWITGDCHVMVHDSEELYVYEETSETNADNRMRWKLENGKLTIRFCKPRLFGKTVDYDKTLYLYVPKSLLGGIESVNIETVSAHLAVKGLKAETMCLNTVSGDLTAEGLACGEGKIASVSGDVMLTACRADTLTVGNTSGNVLLAASEAIAALSVSTVSGDQAVSVPIGTRDLTLAAVSGKITALLPDEVSFALTCESVSGTVEAEESLRLTVSGDTYTRGEETLKGEITAVSGNVALKRLFLITPDEP